MGDTWKLNSTITKNYVWHRKRQQSYTFLPHFPFHLLTMSCLFLFWNKLLLLIPLAYSLFSSPLPSFSPSLTFYFSPPLLTLFHSSTLLCLCTLLPLLSFSCPHLITGIFQNNSSQESFYIQTHTVIRAICQ